MRKIHIAATGIAALCLYSAAFGAEPADKGASRRMESLSSHEGQGKITKKVRRVVTGHNSAGKAIVASDTEVEGFKLGGIEFTRFWGADRPQKMPDDGAQPNVTKHFPPPGGYRFGMITIAPNFVMPVEPQAVQAMMAEMEKHSPGASAYMEPTGAVPGMHTSDTIDLEYILSGEIWLELDDGVQVHLRAGDTLVLNAARHVWHNKGDVPCTILLFFVGVDRQPSGVEVARRLQKK